METLSLSNISILSTKTTTNTNIESRKKMLYRQSSSMFSSESDYHESIGHIKKNKRMKEFGTLNPSLYKDTSHGSSSSGSSFGDIHLSSTWIGSNYDQLKIRILKVKNIPEEYYRAGLYLRYEICQQFFGRVPKKIQLLS